MPSNILLRLIVRGKYDSCKDTNPDRNRYSRQQLWKRHKMTLRSICPPKSKYVINSVKYSLRYGENEEEDIFKSSQSQRTHRRITIQIFDV